MATMSIFDDRLIPADAAPGAGPPNLADNTFRVNAAVHLANAFTWVRDFANGNGGRIPVFNILCHGIYHWVESERRQQSTALGGFGLQLCMETLTEPTIDLIAPLVRGKLGDVMIYACGAANDEAGGTQNGDTFCMALAQKLNCIVYASDRKQVFSYHRSVANYPLDFGEFEGTVSRFTPDRSKVTVGRFPSPNDT